MKRNPNAPPPRHNPLTFYLRVLLYCGVAGLLRALVYAPVGFLFAYPPESPLRWLALLSPALFVFLLLPLRYSFARALVQRPRRRFFSFDNALSLRRYGEKLGEALLNALSVLKWGIPLALMLGYAYVYFPEANSLEMISSLIALGKDAVRIFARVAAFLGRPDIQGAEGGFMEGCFVILGVFGLGGLVLLLGVMRNSATRYIWALSSRDSLNFRGELRRRLRGRRLLQLLFALLNLLLLAPFLWAAARSLRPALGDLSTLMMNALAGDLVGILDVGTAAFPLLAAFLCLYLPLLPIRRMLTAYYAAKRVDAAKAGAARQAPPPPAPSVPAAHAAPAPAYVPPVSSEPRDMTIPYYPEPSPPEIPAPVFPEPETLPPPAEAPAEATAPAPDDRDPSAFTLGQ